MYCGENPSSGNSLLLGTNIMLIIINWITRFVHLRAVVWYIYTVDLEENIDKTILHHNTSLHRFLQQYIFGCFTLISDNK